MTTLILPKKEAKRYAWQKVRQWLSALLTVLLLAFAAKTKAQNPVQCPGFECGNFTDSWSFPGYYGAGTATLSTAAHSGIQSLKLNSDPAVAEQGEAMIRQKVYGLKGNYGKFSAYFKNLSSLTAAVNVSAVFYDEWENTISGRLSYANFTLTADEDWTEKFIVPKETPEEASYMEVTITLSGGAIILVDDVSLEAAKNAIMGFTDIAKTMADADFKLTAKANSGNPVSYTIADPSIATITGNTVHLLKAGTTTITATESDAEPVTVNLTVKQAIIGFANIAKTMGDADFQLTARSSTGNAISYTLADPSIATITGSMVHLLKVGTTTLTATEGAIDPITVNFTVQATDNGARSAYYRAEDFSTAAEGWSTSISTDFMKTSSSVWGVNHSTSLGQELGGIAKVKLVNAEDPDADFLKQGKNSMLILPATRNASAISESLQFQSYNSLRPKKVTIWFAGSKSTTTNFEELTAGNSKYIDVKLNNFDPAKHTYQLNISDTYGDKTYSSGTYNDVGVWHKWVIELNNSMDIKKIGVTSNVRGTAIYRPYQGAIEEAVNVGTPVIIGAMVFDWDTEPTGSDYPQNLQAQSISGLPTAINLNQSTKQLELNATASSGEEVFYVIDDANGVAEIINGNTIKALKDGETTLTVIQAGTAGYASVIKTIKVTVSGTLPVELISFTAKAENNRAKLDWSTAQELNNQKFVVYRKGETGEFTEIGNKPGAGTVATPQNYTFYDNAPLNGTNYYKLVQVDNDGKETELGVKSLNFGLQTSDIGLKVYPNPIASGILWAKFAEAKGGATLNLLNVQGKTLAHEAVAPGSSQTSMNVSRLAAGVYVLVYSNGADVVTSKVIIK